ncbi:MAG: DUF6550 family protein [Oscillospiraceae bacterium]
MKKKVKITTAVLVAIISLLIIPLYNQQPREPPVPDTSPTSASVELDRGNTSPAENKAVVADESHETGTQNPPQDSTPTESDFEPPNTADSKGFLTETNAPSGNPAPTPAPSKNKTAATASEPKMGDTRTVDGQKQVYFLGFGWIDDNEEPNQGVYVDGDGDINKMVGRMD